MKDFFMKRVTSFSIILAFSLLFIFNDSFADKRMVLLEEFTNASCGPCAAQNPSFKAYLKQNSENIIPIIYHWYYPGRDVMYDFAPENSEKRMIYYNQNGVPVVATNGKIHLKTSDQTYNGAPGDTPALTAEVAKYANSTSPITITPSFTLIGNNMDIKVPINSTSAISGKILRVVVVEGYHFYENAGTNGEKDFYYVVRAMLPDYKGQSINVNADETKEFNFQYNVKTELFKQFLYVVAFIQDDVTKEVLQTGVSATPKLDDVETYSKVSLNLTIDASQKQGYVETGVTQSRKITVQNPTIKEIKAGISINPNGFPKDWSVTLDKSEVTIPAQGSVEVSANITAGTTTSYSSIQFDVLPIDLPDNVLPIFKSVTSNALSKNTKYVYYYGMSNFDNYYIQVVGSATKYNKDLAYIPMLDMDALKAYPPSNFDALVYTFDYFGIANAKGLLGNNYTQSVAIRQNIKDAAAAGKDVLIIAESEIFTTMNTAADVNGKAFFNNDLGVSCSQAIQRITVNSQGLITSVVPYSVQGVADDPISNGLNLNCNNHVNSGSVFSIQTDLLTLSAGSKAIPFLFYDNDQTKIGGVRLENANGAKTVFMTNPLGCYSYPDGINLFTKIMDWFNAGIAPKAPQISSSVTSINFSKVNINNQETRDVELTNTGEQDLTFTGIKIEDDAAGLYTISAGGNLSKIIPGAKATITVSFAPKDTKTYSATLRIQSNSASNSDLKISLTGQGTVSSVDEELFSKYMQVSVGPNPVKEISTVSYTLNSQTSQYVTMKLIDQTGRIVSELVNGNIESGSYSAQLNSANYSAGVYYLISSVNGVSSQIPVVIFK
jgi:hypothetical protein